MKPETPLTIGTAPLIRAASSSAMPGFDLYCRMAAYMTFPPVAGGLGRSCGSNLRLPALHRQCAGRLRASISQAPGAGSAGDAARPLATGASFLTAPEAATTP